MSPAALALVASSELPIPTLDVPAGTSSPAIPPSRALTTEELADRIAEISAHLHAAEYQLLTLLREFDMREGWGHPGFRSCAQWLSWRTGIAPGPARERVRVARALATLPRVADAMRRGQLSWSKVRAITRVATPANEAELLEFALTGTAAHVERVVRGWRRVDRLEAARDERARHRQRYLELSTDHTGAVRIEGLLDPEVAAVLQRALEAAADALFQREPARDSMDANPSGPEASGAKATGGETTEADQPPPDHRPTATQRRADALGFLAERALAAGFARSSGATRADRFQVMVHVDAAELAEDAADGGASLETHLGADLDVPAGTFRRLACDASTVTMVHGADGAALTVGRRTRTVPPAIRRALRHRDRGCRFPGCGNRFADAHHIRHWADGGETRLENLVLLCRHHHRAVHEEGVQVERLDDGSFRFTAPDARELRDAPPLPALAPDWDALDPGGWTHTREGLVMTPWTSSSRWNGEPLDLPLAVRAFRGLREEA
ncbi:MAG: DUF222 domain-containing protein [Gemmatimonadota bacterium]|nr:DUF222 domain-containing protein [Gemmatimonadota bacterium]